MQEKSKNLDTRTKQIEQRSAPLKKPNDSGYLWVEDRIKIFDPKTKEIFVQGRS